MQTVNYASSMPIYCLVHLFTTPITRFDLQSLARHLEIENIEVLKDLPISIVIGYGIPTILAGVPFSSSLLHQWFGGFWQGHPIWIVLVQSLIAFLRKKLARISPESAIKTT